MLLRLFTISLQHSHSSDPEAKSNVSGQSVQVRPLQFPMQHLQQTVPVQVPVTASNGQTIYQTVHFPIQALSNVFNMPTAQMIPQITQVTYINLFYKLILSAVNNNLDNHELNFYFFKQIPQMAQIITPNGQIQQVQIANLSQLQSLQVSC